MITTNKLTCFEDESVTTQIYDAKKFYLAKIGDQKYFKNSRKKDETDTAKENRIKKLDEADAKKRADAESLAKKKKDEFKPLITEEQQKKLQELADEMIGIASNVIEEYDDLDFSDLDLSGSLDSLTRITQIHEDSPYLNEVFKGESWKKVISAIQTIPTNPVNDEKNDTE